jgi:hypothetical protein
VALALGWTSKVENQFFVEEGYQCEQKRLKIFCSIDDAFSSKHDVNVERKSFKNFSASVDHIKINLCLGELPDAINHR